MRILHTSDWHIGNSLFSYNRDEEFRFFIDELTQIVSKYLPDILIIAGDIYDNTNPTLNSRRLFTDALISLCSANPKMKIIATAGNHDSGSNLDVLSPLLKDEIVIVGRKPAINRYENEKGEGVVIVAVPFISENGFRCRLPEEFSTCDNPRREFYGLLLKKAHELSVPSDKIIMIAHEAVSNADFTGQEKYNFNFCSLECLHTGYNYLALGHIHRPQTIQTLDISVARYSGSPLPMGFDESFEHSVTLVDFHSDKKQPTVESIKLSPLVPMLTLPVEKPLDENEVVEFVESLIEQGIQGYLRLRVKSSHPLPSLTARLRNLCAGTQLRFCLLKLENDEEIAVDVNTRPVTRFSIADLHTVDPMTLALNYYQRKTGTLMSEEMRRCLYNVLMESED